MYSVEPANGKSLKLAMLGVKTETCNLPTRRQHSALAGPPRDPGGLEPVLEASANCTPRTSSDDDKRQLPIASWKVVSGELSVAV